MVRYKPRKGEFVIGNSVVSAGRAKRIRDGLDKKIRVHKAYQSCDRIPDECAVTELTIEILCMDKEKDNSRFLKIGFALDNERTVDDIPSDIILKWLSEYETHGSVIVRETDVEDLFNSIDGDYSGFKVESPDVDEVKDLYEQN